MSVDVTGPTFDELLGAGRPVVHQLVEVTGPQARPGRAIHTVYALCGATERAYPNRPMPATFTAWGSMVSCGRCKLRR